MHNLKVDIKAVVRSVDNKIKEYDFLSTDGVENKYYFTDEHGYPEEKKPAKSFVRNFMGWLVGCFNSVIITGDVKSTSNSNLTSSNPFMEITGSSGNANKALVVGTDSGVTLPLAATNYAMGAKIANGTGGGQLSYGAITIPQPAVVGSDYVIALSRKFANGSAGSITVGEVGLIAYLEASSLTPVLLARDVGVGKAIAAGENSTLTYNIITSDSSGFTKNFLKAIYKQFSNGGGISTPVKSIDGTSATPVAYGVRAFQTGTAYFRSVPNVGIVVGTGGGAENWDDYALGKYIACGGASGQLLQGCNAVFPVSVVSNTSTSVIKREFFNHSGDTITIKELGIYGYNDSIVGKQVMFFRRLLSSPVVVANGSSVLFIVTFSVTT